MTIDQALDIVRRFWARGRKVTYHGDGYGCPHCGRRFSGTGGWNQSAASNHAESCVKPTPEEEEACKIVAALLSPIVAVKGARMKRWVDIL